MQLTKSSNSGLEKSGRHVFFKITDGGKEIGKYGLSFYDDIGALGVGSLEVYPEHRNRGHGSSTIKSVVDKYCGRYGLIYCVVDAGNEGALRLYRRLGKEISDRPDDNGQYVVVLYRAEAADHQSPERTVVLQRRPDAAEGEVEK